jgi:hypothetical protein
MLKNIFLLLLISLPLLSLAQSNTCLLKTYAFSRAVLGGAAPTEIVEMNGSTSTQPSKNNKQYFIYLKTCYVSQVTITGIWINGDSYTAKAEKVNTPVMLDDGNVSSKSKKELLIPKTTSRVWEVLLSRDETMLKPTRTIQNMIKANNVVITGILKGKMFTTSLKNIKELEAIAAQ